MPRGTSPRIWPPVTTGTSTPRPAVAGRVLVDTSALLALASRRDQYHARALTARRRLRAEGVRLVGTMLVLAELHGHLLYRLGPEPARELVEGLLEDPAHHWIEVGADLAREAVARWLWRLRGRRVSLTDAVSFEVMRRERLTEAFAFDDDFAAAGYALVR